MKDFDSDVSFFPFGMHADLDIQIRIWTDGEAGYVTNRQLREREDAKAHVVVINILGVYTHAQLDKRFWDAVGHQLGGKGKEYKRRSAIHT